MSTLELSEQVFAGKARTKKARIRIMRANTEGILEAVTSDN
jgi:hypothetical protein